MSDPNANFVNRLYEKAGRNLELAATSQDSEEQMYWAGHANEDMELIAEHTDQTLQDVKEVLVDSFNEMVVGEQVDAMFMDTTVKYVRAIIDDVLKGGGGGVVDSHQIAALEYRRRVLGGQEADINQTHDYVQYVLREMNNVCRHCVGNGHYIVHVETVCSGICKEKYAYWAKSLGREIQRCKRCNLELPISGECGLCG